MSHDFGAPGASASGWSRTGGWGLLDRLRAHNGSNPCVVGPYCSSRLQSCSVGEEAQDQATRAVGMQLGAGKDRAFSLC